MDPKVQRLVDHFEIREVIEAYVHACDRCDRDAVEDVYHPDSWDDHGPMKMTGPQFADAVTESLSTVWKGATHLLGQSRIRVDGDMAGAETTFFASLTRDDEGTEMLDLMVGRYVDVMERRDGVWAIKDRRCISEWSSSGPIGVDFMRGDLFMHGSRSAEDPSYEVLKLVAGRARIDR